jgi:hypothetical protein
MQKSKMFYRIKFSPDVIREALGKYLALEELEEDDLRAYIFKVVFKNEDWRLDEDFEFYAEYRKEPKEARFFKNFGGDRAFDVVYFGEWTTVEVSSERRSVIEEVFEVFESYLEESMLPPPEKEPIQGPVVFIGHGQDPQWRDLKDHLHEKHGYDVEAYEIGERAGHAVRDILEEMMDESSFALLVMTGEDETAGGALRARQNVIHEAGLFQGRLGFSRAIILLEEGTEEFSNIHGIQQIRFSKGNIRETFGDVLATLRREFTDEED